MKSRELTVWKKAEAAITKKFLEREAARRLAFDREVDTLTSNFQVLYSENYDLMQVIKKL